MSAPGPRIRQRRNAVQPGSDQTGGPEPLDLVTIILCMCIGNAVAWLLAIYTRHGARDLIWNVVFGALGVALLAVVLSRVLPDWKVAGLVFAGPLFALAAIGLGTAARHLAGVNTREPGGP